MANDFSGNPFILDTVSASAMHYTDPIRVKNVRWASATTAGHGCIIVDSNGDVLWQSVASGANYVESDIIERWWQKGFRLSGLGSGTVYIAYE